VILGVEKGQSCCCYGHHHTEIQRKQHCEWLFLFGTSSERLCNKKFKA
jgi:hypothetical protein